jgi:membrane protease YdiL (CAAX protease family)
MYTLAIVASYSLLLLISLFFDPKRKSIAKGYSIFHLLFFSTFKMLSVIGLVVAFALLGKNDMTQALGVSAFSAGWRNLVLGVVTAVGFFLIYIFWQLIASRFVMKAGETQDAGSRIIGLLPKRWLPLIGVFVMISTQAGLLEEIFFRGIMQSEVACYTGMPWAVIICGILFGIAHFYQGVSGIVGTSILGIWLGLSFAMTGNILLPILGHILGDFACMMLGGRSIIGRKIGTPAV